MDNRQVDRDLSPRARIALFSALTLLGLGYVAAFAFFLNGSHDFIAREIEAQARAYAVAHPLSLPTALELRSGSPHASLLGSGWHRPDADAVWTQGKEASLYVRLPEGLPIQLELDIQAFVPRKGPEAEVSLATDSGTIGSWRVTTDASFLRVRVRLPPGESAPRKLLLRFSRPGSPRRVGVGPDSRTLGVKLIGIRASADGPT